MKKALKVCLSVILAALMVFGSTSIAFAGNDVTPVIIVHGLGGSDLYKDPGTGSQTQVGTFDILSLLGENNSVLHAALDALKGKTTDIGKFLDEAKKIVNGFTVIACDKNGNSAENVGITNYWTDSLANHKDYLESRTSAEPAIARQICDEIGAQNVYSFNYDWRLDACENGEKLDKFIDIVKQQTGKSKVTLIGGSEGTLVVAAYIDAHKAENEVEKVVYLNGAMNGVSVTNVFSMDIEITKEILTKYVNDLFKTMNNRDFDFSRLAWLSETTGDTMQNVENLVNDILNDDALLKKLYNEVLYPVFGNIPAFWEFIPYDGFDKAVEAMSGIGFLDKSSGLYTKLVNYHNVQGRLVSNIKYLKNNGVQVAIVANYGKPGLPVTSSNKDNTDILIDTKYASIGARVAQYGKRLSNKRTATNKYASPDEVIDASTCAFPENTWFIKGIQHMDFWYNSDACKFIATLVTTKTQTTVSKIKKATGVPQFVGTDKEENIVDIASTSPKKVSISKKNVKKNSITIKWNVTNQNKKLSVKGYQVEYSTTSDFSKNVKKINISGGSKSSATIKKLKSSKKYYVRVRSYRLVANKKIYSPWSTVKEIKTK